MAKIICFTFYLFIIFILLNRILNTHSDNRWIFRFIIHILECKFLLWKKILKYIKVYDNVFLTRLAIDFNVIWEIYTENSWLICFIDLIRTHYYHTLYTSLIIWQCFWRPFQAFEKIPLILAICPSDRSSIIETIFYWIEQLHLFFIEIRPRLYQFKGTNLSRHGDKM